MPGWQAWLFSAKTFAAAMLALWIAFAANLDNPYWAMATVYFVSQPLSGATRSKAAYRMMGTLLGAIASIVLVPNLANTPVLLVAAIAVWTAGCLTLALLDQTPRSYVFMLAAYSVSFIGLPSVDQPLDIWNTVVARTEEIALGIVCASLVASLVLPRNVGPVVADRTRVWLDNAWQWGRDVLEASDTLENTRTTRRRLVADAAEIDTLASHLAFDPSIQQQALHRFADLRVRMLMLLPVISSLSDRLAALRDAGGLPPGAADTVAQVAALMPSDAPAPAALDDAVAALQSPLDPRSDWSAILLAALAIRLRDLLDLHADCLHLQRAIAAGGGRLHGALRFQPGLHPSAVHHRDRGMAVFSGVSAGVAVGLICAFWIASAWPDGALAAMMAAVACCLFAALDNPVPAIVSFLSWTVVALVVDGIYLFAILPLVHDFGMLVLALAPAYLVFGTLATRPATAPIGLALAAAGATLLGLQASYNANFASFVNSAIAAVVGMGVAAVLTQVIRSVGSEWGILRLMRANWASLAQAARRRGADDRAAFAVLMLDRFAQAVPRLAAAGQNSPLQAADALRDLRIGLNIIDLRRAGQTLQPAGAATVGRVLDDLAAYYGGLSHRPWSGGFLAPEARLLACIDRALAAITAEPQGAPGRDALLGLVGIRRGLFPDAPPYAPLPKPPDRRVESALWSHAA
ncbi:MAG: FUSC family protein [Acetobacteraceae bacterium]